MHVLTKSGFSLAVAGLLVCSLYTSVADAAKESHANPKDDALAQCKAGCQSRKGDPEAFENCMIKCVEEHGKSKAPTAKKK